MKSLLADKFRAPSFRARIAVAAPGIRSARKRHLARPGEHHRTERQLRETNRQLEKLIGERNAQLEAARHELEAFSYSVSHDLRAPLRAIAGYSCVLLEDYQDKLDAEGQRLLNVVRDKTRVMEQLIDGILKFSRANTTAMTVVEIDMTKLFREVLDELLPEDGKIAIAMEALPATKGDRAMLRQVVDNLISNALKFSRRSTTPAVTIRGSTKDDETAYSIADNGVGFDETYIDKLFGVFQRLHGPAEFEGTGIGLAVVKRIVERHGGRVWATGKVGEGASFGFALPRA